MWDVPGQADYFTEEQACCYQLDLPNCKKMKCHLELRLPSESFGFSVFIESMRIENTTGCSKDFLQFGR